MSTQTNIPTFLYNKELHTISACVLLVSLFAAYMYFLSATVVHVVIRKEVSSEISHVNSEISKLEAEYIKQQHAVSSDVASQRGFVAVRDKIFLDRSDTTLVMSTNRP